MVVVSRASREQWRTLRDIRLRALREAPYAFGPTYAEEAGRTQADWCHVIDRLVWFLAQRDQVPEGVAALMPPRTPGDNWELLAMWVTPRRRGSDTATALMRAARDFAHDTGARSMHLSVSDGNDRARRFYARMGFVATGVREPMRSNPAIGVDILRHTWTG